MAGKHRQIFGHCGLNRFVHAMTALILLWAAHSRHHRCFLTVGSYFALYQLSAVSVSAAGAWRGLSNHGWWVTMATATRISGEQTQKGTEKGEGGVELGGDEILLSHDVSSQDLSAFHALQAGVELYEQGDVNGSINHYRLAISLKRDLVLAWVKLGVALTDVNREGEAIAAYKAVIEIPTIFPLDAATALCNHGHLVQTRAGTDYALLEEGLSLFRRGLEVAPNHANCMYNLGLGLEKFARYDEARILYTRALEVDSSMGNAHLNLGNIAFRTGDWKEGVSHYERAYSSLNADQRLRSVSSFMLGQIHRHVIGKVRKAVEYYKRSYTINNDYSSALASILQSLRSLCLWEDWEVLEPRVASLIMADIDLGREPGPQSPYESRLTGELKPSYHLGLARLASKRYDLVTRLPLKEEHLYTFRRRLEERAPDTSFEVYGGPLKARFQQRGHEFSRKLESHGGEDGTRLVVAYWSFDLREHPMGYLTRGLFCSHQLHNRIFVVTTSYGRNDGSFIRHSAEKCAGKFLDVAELGDVEAAEVVARERPEIFVDLMAHTTGARPGIPALKPAPIVASYLGYPGTVGAEFNDYTIADKTVLPPELAEIGFSEKLVYIPDSYQANDYNISHPFCGGGEHLRECQELIRRKRGLSSLLDRWGGKGPVLCNYNTIHKMEPESFTVFMNILRRVPGSVLLLLDSSLDSDDGVELNLNAEAAARGVHPSRIKLDKMLPRAEHMWRVSGSCDIFIDSFVYGAHTTAADALWAGLPLLTLRGYGLDDTPVGQMSGRVGTSLLTTLGLPELSFHATKELEDATVSLLKSPHTLSILRKRLLSAAMTSPLFDTHRIATNLERAYEVMWEIKVMGLSPQHLVVDPTQGVLPPIHLEFEGDDGIEDANSPATESQPQKNVLAGEATRKTSNGMIRRAIEIIMAWEEERTEEGAEAALAATGRLLAEDPLSIDGMHLMGVALHFLNRNEEAAVAMEKAALLATARNYKQGIDSGMLWRNLEVVQLAMSDTSGRSIPLETFVKPFLKGLTVDPSEPTLLHIILKAQHRRREYSSCASTFWTYWARIRGSHHLEKEAESSFSQRNAEGDFFNKGYGDGWAWDTWERGDKETVSAVADVAASCFAGVGRFEEAWRAWRFATEVQQTSQTFPLHYAAALNAAGYIEEAHGVFDRVVTRLNHIWFHLEGGSEVVRWLRPGGLEGQEPPTVVALYCYEYGNAWFPNWGPSSLGKGLGGSEEIVIHLSRELAKLGFWVEIYGDPVGGDVGPDRGGSKWKSGGGVVWYPFKAYDVSNPPDVFVAWRYHISLHLGAGSQHRFLWLQDVLKYPFPTSLTNTLDGVICPSLYHASLIQPAPVRALGRVLPNGIDPEIFRDGGNSPDLFIYGSAPNRGLRAVLMSWAYIRSEIPTATLEVYYGFSPTFVEWGKIHMTYFDKWMAQMEVLLNQEGVLYKGMVDHDTLHDAYARAGFVLYPTAFPETGCVSLIKAMAMGAIPITSRFPNSTLPELTADWDMGPTQPLSSQVRLAEHDLSWLESWAHAVVKASRIDSVERLGIVEGKDSQLNNEGAQQEYLVHSNVSFSGDHFTSLPRAEATIPMHSSYSALYARGEVSGRGHLSVDPSTHVEETSVQARRRAMKLAIREKFEFSGTAKLWAREMEGRG